MLPILKKLSMKFKRIIKWLPNRSMEDVLAHVKKIGFYPRTLIDVGVAHGTYELYEPFPDAFLLLIEPLEEFEESIKSILRKYRGTYEIVAASADSGEIEINIHPEHLAGSSLLKEEMGEETDGFKRIVRKERIDNLIKINKLTGPFILKIDVQGAELDVLNGIDESIDEIELILLEVSFFKFLKGGPQFHDVVGYMKNRGFVAYDIYGGAFRPLDGSLGQIDMAFVKENGRFRKNHAYATAEQWTKIRARKDKIDNIFKIFSSFGLK
jgi:FkbM family methyltransferase